MRKTFLTLIAVLLLIACSSDDNEQQKQQENKLQVQLLGKWLFENPNNNPETNNSFVFTSEGVVTYSYWKGNEVNSYGSETGIYSFKGDIMTMKFPEGINLTFVQKVIFVNENVVEFKETGIEGEEAYKGDYFREGASNYDNNNNNGQMKIIFNTGNVLNSSWGSSCYGLSSDTDKINTRLTFYVDGEEIEAYDYSMLPGYQVNEEKNVLGNILSAKLELVDFNPNVLNKDIHVYDISVSIENKEGKVISSKFIGELYYCNDSKYEIVCIYDVNNDSFTLEEKTHSF